MPNQATYTKWLLLLRNCDEFGVPWIMDADQSSIYCGPWNQDYDIFLDGVKQEKVRYASRKEGKLVKFKLDYKGDYIKTENNDDLALEILYGRIDFVRKDANE